MRNRLRERQEWKFFGALPRADPALATAWWTILVLRVHRRLCREECGSICYIRVDLTRGEGFAR